MKLPKFVLWLIVAALMLAACTPGQTEAPALPPAQPAPTEPAGTQNPSPAVEMAADWLARELNVDLSDIEKLSVEEADWSDSCLGLGGPAESCLAVITPGYRMEFVVGGETYVVRTDRAGLIIRAENLEGPKGGEAVVPDPQSEAAQQAAIRALAEQFGLDIEGISVTDVQQVDWPDSCLGVHRPEEMCLAAITPGYRILLEADGQPYQVNTNLDGSAFRVLDEVQPLPEGGTDVEGSEAAVAAARTYLAQQLGIPAEAVRLVMAEAVEWSNSCLGVEMPNRACAEVITPGYQIILEADGRQYEFHTDAGGGAVAAALAPLSEDEEGVMTWQEIEGETCRYATFDAKAVHVGPCEGELETAELSEERQAELAYYYGAFEGFEAETPAGKVVLAGAGQRPPSEAEQRSVAEWVRLVVAESLSGRGDAADEGLVVQYHREGGFAGFCADAYIYASGWVETVSCRGGQQTALEPYRLNGEELEQLYAWMDSLEGFEYEHTDAATADAMTVRVYFEGQGEQEAAAEEQEQIGQFADMVLSGASIR